MKAPGGAPRPRLRSMPALSRSAGPAIPTAGSSGTPRSSATYGEVDLGLLGE